ncbi:MAG: 3-oxoacyl-ACP synthase [bacterium]
MNLLITSYCLITESKVVVNDQLHFYQENFLNFANFIKSIYKQEEINYPKFYKMDSLSKLGFLSSELVLKASNISRYREEEVGVIMMNSSSSLDTDIVHQDSIKDSSNYFPSPSVFVYTLPNILIGEICIKNKIKGENAFLISETFDAELIRSCVENLMREERLKACLCGWVELLGEKFESLLVWVEKAGSTENQAETVFRPLPFTEETLKQLLHRN